MSSGHSLVCPTLRDVFVVVVVVVVVVLSLAHLHNLDCAVTGQASITLESKNTSSKKPNVIHVAYAGKSKSNRTPYTRTCGACQVSAWL